MESISYLPEIRSENSEEIAERLNNYVQHFEILGEKVFESFILVDSSGKIKSCSPYKKEYIGLNYSHYPFFKGIIDEKEEIYLSSDSWISAITSKPMVRIAIPVKESEDKISGVLAADISLSALRKVSNQTQIGATGQSFILDKKGVFISYPEKKLVLERQNINNVLPELFNEMREKEFGIILWPKKDPHTIFSFSSPQTAEWKVVFSQSLDEALKVPSALQTMFTLSLVFILFLATIIVFLLTAMITQPIKKLREIAKTMAQGNLEIRADINTKDEIEDLAKDFNIMAEKLKGTRSSLEVKVEERTKELKQLTKTLEEQVNQRTRELRGKVQELEKFQRLAVDREIKMVELKKKIQRLEE
jgi:methyl-accepting chemotaxis protein